MLKFNDYLKEAALSAKQKKIAAVAGDKDKIDAQDLAALRAGKKPVEEASCSSKDMKKEELVGNQHKLDKNKNGKLDAHDFKLLRKEEAELDEAIVRKDGKLIHADDTDKPVKDSHFAKDVHQTKLAKHLGKHTTGDVYFDDVDLVRGEKTVMRNAIHPKYNHTVGDLVTALKKHANDVKEEVELEEGRMKDLAYDLDNMSHDEFHKQYGHPKHHYDPTNFKKPVEPGKGMDRAKALAQRGMQSLSKEEVERIEEKLTQLDELSKKTLGSYAKKATKELKSQKTDYDYLHSDDDPEHEDDGSETMKGFDSRRIRNKEKGIDRAVSKLAKEEVEQEMSPYLKGTLKVMDEGKIDNLRDAQKLRRDTQSAYEKDYKPDTSHPHIQVVKGNAYGGANQKDDEGDEKPDETKEKKGRGRPAGSKSGARQKGGGHEDGGIPVHNLNLPKSYK